MVYKLFQRILVPLDGSEHSFKALEEAAQLAKLFSGEITLVHVYSMPPIIQPRSFPQTWPSGPILTGGEVPMLVEEAKKIGNRILEDGEQRTKTMQVQVKKMLVEGQVVREIVRLANEGNYDLIVIGARGVSRMREKLQGSITDGVIDHAHCPVLVIK